MHLHAHILDLVLTPNEPSVVSNVCVGVGGSCTGALSAVFISPSAHKSNIATFQRYHKIHMHSLKSDLIAYLLDVLAIQPSMSYMQGIQVARLINMLLWCPETFTMGFTCDGQCYQVSI